jgi:hypothetical protein
MLAAPTSPDTPDLDPNQDENVQICYRRHGVDRSVVGHVLSNAFAEALTPLPRHNMSRQPSFFVAIAAVCGVVIALGASAAAADEGMWTFNNFPSDKVQKAYGFKPDQAWLDKVRLGSARLAQGCSASFVSPDGLVMTNHHCVHRCVAQLSTKTSDYVKGGFFAKTTKAETKCPNLEINQLISITDVTAAMNAATAGKTGAAWADAQKAETARITKACATSDDLRCDVVTLYKGGRHDLYTYRRYQDVRLVFAPELAIAFFGGDPDNFNFPRYDLDAAFVRVYADDKPLAAQNYLPFSKTPAKAGDLTFVSGHPGHTSREYTMAELSFERDFSQPRRLYRLAEIRGRLLEFMKRGPEQARIAESDLFSVENQFKARFGRQQALADEAFWASRIKSEQALVAGLKDPTLKAEVQTALKDIEGALRTAREIWPAYVNLEGRWAMGADTFGHARNLIRLVDELPKENGTRLKEFSDAALPGMKAALRSTAPIYPDLEVLKLEFGLSKMREMLTADDPLVKGILGKRSPDQVAKALVKGTKLNNVAARQALVDAAFAGKRDAIDKSTDPMIVFARQVDGDARALRKRFEDEVESVLDRANEVIAKARFVAYGESVYPDATFTLRLSYGKVQGWRERGVDITPITTVGGAFERHTGAEPFALPKSWLGAKKRLDLTTPMNMVTTNDIIGGNSGSPVINQAGEVVGLIFDGNIHSLGGEYGFNPDNNRAVSVHTSVILEALRKIYGAGRIADELEGKGLIPRSP